MSAKTFAKGHTYGATNLRTRETFTVTCIGNTLNGPIFVDANNNTYKADYLSGSPFTYNIRAHVQKHHIYIDTEAA